MNYYKIDNLIIQKIDSIFIFKPSFEGINNNLSIDELKLSTQQIGKKSILILNIINVLS